METAKPIGFWLKHLHNLLERQLDATLADLSLTRRHWQVLNTLSQAEYSRDDLARALAPFWETDTPDLDAVLDGPDGLATRGWTRPGSAPGTLTLTDSGYAAHSRAAERIKRSRALLVEGLTPRQYMETVRNLATMAGNVEAALAGQDRH